MEPEQKTLTGKWNIQLQNGPVIGPLSVIWERDGYIYGSYHDSQSMNQSPYALLHHGILWIQRLEDGRIGLQRADGGEEFYSGYTVEGTSR